MNSRTKKPIFYSSFFIFWHLAISIGCALCELFLCFQTCTKTSCFFREILYHYWSSKGFCAIFPWPWDKSHSNFCAGKCNGFAKVLFDIVNFGHHLSWDMTNIKLLCLMCHFMHLQLCEPLVNWVSLHLFSRACPWPTGTGLYPICKLLLKKGICLINVKCI